MTYNNLYEIYNCVIGSPLDQFGEDESSFDILDWSILSTFFGSRVVTELLDWSALTEIQSFDDWISIAIGNAGVFIFDDEDSDSSEWEETDISTSSLQASIFTSNIIGMLPGVSTSTSDASLTFMLSISTIIGITLLGFSLHGIRYLAILYPNGTPVVMAPFIILIEFVSYVARAVSLGVRLFANMFAGHSLVKILMSFAWLFFNSTLPVLAIPVYVLLLAIFMMEVGIAYLQSYVFSALAAMYIEDAISLGH